MTLRHTTLNEVRDQQREREREVKHKREGNKPYPTDRESQGYLP